MADEAIISTTDEIVGQEGSLETIENVTLEEHEPRLVPERDLLAVKDKAQRKDNELREARARIAELEAATRPTSPLAAEFEWVDEAFLAAVERRIEQKAEEKLAPLLSQQKKSEFDTKFDKLFSDQLAKAENVDTSKVDKDVIKALALSPQYRSVPLKDIIEKLHKTEPTWRATTENDMRPATELVKDVVDVDNVSKEQLDRIWKDPKARSEYLAKKFG